MNLANAHLLKRFQQQVLPVGPALNLLQDERQVLLQVAQADAAKEAVSQLSIPLRTVFILSVFQEMSYQEIADALEISPGTVASRKHEAVQLLRQKMIAWKETQ